MDTNINIGDAADDQADDDDHCGEAYAYINLYSLFCSLRHIFRHVKFGGD